MTGYVRDISLLYILGYETTIIAITLVSMIIPLIIMLSPTFLTAKRTPYGKKIVVPMLLLTSVVCVSTGLIPAWLFFVLIFCFGCFLFLSRGEER